MISRAVSLSVLSYIGKLSYVSCLSDKTTTNKLNAGYKAVDDYVKSGMTIGLGTGSTVYFSTNRIYEKLLNGELKDIKIIPSTKQIEKRCNTLGIPISNLQQNPIVHIMIDGCDEVDPNLNLLIGSNGSFLHEKLIQSSSNKVVIICDDSKVTNRIGTGMPIPVEIVPFSFETTCKRLETIPGSRAMLRRGNINNVTPDGFDIAITEDGNFIVDLYFDKPVENLQALSDEVYKIPGVVEIGLVLGSNPILLIASERGVKVIKEKPNENVWKELLPYKRSLKRESLDNTIP